MKKLLNIILLTSTICSTSCKTSNENLVKFYARKYKIQEDVLIALIKVESSFNPRAVSDKGALGLMQVMPKWHRKRCKLRRDEDLFKPSVNLRCGCSHLRERYEEDYSIFNALAKYYAGNRGHETKAGRGYARKVLNRVGEI